MVVFVSSQNYYTQCACEGFARSGRQYIGICRVGRFRQLRINSRFIFTTHQSSFFWLRKRHRESNNAIYLLRFRACCAPSSGFAVVRANLHFPDIIDSSFLTSTRTLITSALSRGLFEGNNVEHGVTTAGSHPSCAIEIVSVVEKNEKNAGDATGDDFLM